MSDTDQTNEIEASAEKCSAYHSDHGNANCTGRCKLKKGHWGKHEDQFGHKF